MTNNLVQQLTYFLVDQIFQIESASDDQINEDFAVSLMETVGAELQSLPPDDLSSLVRVISDMAASERDEERKEFLSSFVENFGLDEGFS